MIKKRTLKSLDISPYIGEIVLSDGESVLEIPKLSAGRLLGLVKFLGVEIARLWEEAREIAMDGSYTDQEKLIQTIEMVPEDKLFGIISVLTDLDEESSMSLDINEVLDILLVYLDKTDVAKTFLQIQNLYEKIYKKPMPKISDLFKEAQDQAQEQLQAKDQKEKDGKTA